MSRSLLSFLLGVAVTTSIFVFVHSKPIETASPTDTVDPDQNPPSSSVHSSDDQRVSEAASSASELNESATATTQVSPLASTGAEGLSETELRRRLTELQSDYYQARFALQEQLIAKTLDADPVLLPSVLPPEFDWVAQDASVDFFHEQFQRELIDASWASQAESELLRYFNDQSTFVQKYGYPTIRCRSSRCEVTLVGYGSNEDMSTVSAEISTLLSDLANNPRSEEVSCGGPGWCVRGVGGGDGVTSIYFGVTRSEQ